MVIGTNIMDPKFSSKLLVLFHGETHGLESWSTPYFRFSRVLEGFPRSVCARSSDSYCADFGLEGVIHLYNDVHHYIKIAGYGMVSCKLSLCVYDIIWIKDTKTAQTIH